MNQREGHGWPKLTDARGGMKAHVIQSNRRATVAQTAENVGSVRKVPEYSDSQCVAYGAVSPSDHFFIFC